MIALALTWIAGSGGGAGGDAGSESREPVRRQNFMHTVLGQAMKVPDTSPMKSSRSSKLLKSVLSSEPRISISLTSSDLLCVVMMVRLLRKLISARIVALCWLIVGPKAWNS